MTKARDLANIISGGFTVDDIPNIPASKITSGTFADARLPSTALNSNVDLTNLSASNLTSGTVPTARITALPTGLGGKVLQVVSAHTATVTSCTSSTYIDTTLTASITPSSSSNKVVVFVNQSFQKIGSTYAKFKMLRDSTDIGGVIPLRAVGYTGTTLEIYMGMAFNYSFQDSPSSSSALTYKTQFNNAGNSGTTKCQPDSSQSYMLLMEVAG